MLVRSLGGEDPLEEGVATHSRILAWRIPMNKELCRLQSMGSADGAFVMQKEKRTDNKAVLEVAGRDQQDQRLLLDFDREQCVWKLTKAETELWKEPADPVLEAIAKVVLEEQPQWSGTASELLQLLPEMDMQPNILTRKLNISMESLFVDYGIRYESKRGHSSRMIKLTLEQRA